MKTLDKVLKQLQARGYSVATQQALEDTRDLAEIAGAADSSEGTACEWALSEFLALRVEHDEIEAALRGAITREKRAAAKRLAYEAAHVPELRVAA